MKKQIIWFLIIISLSFVFDSKLHSQNRIEVLEKNLINSINEKRVDILNELAYLYNKTDFSKAKNFQNESIELAKKINYKKGLAQGFNNLGDFYKVRSKFKNALYYYEKSLDLAIEFKNTHAEYLMNYSIALCYGQIANYSVSKKYFKRALTLAESLPTEKFSEINLKSHLNNIAELYLRIANILVSENNHNQAIEYIEKSINISIKSNNINSIISSYNTLTELLISTKEFSKAERFIDSAIILSKQNNLLLDLAESYSKKAELLESINNYDEALKYCDSSININKQFNEHNLIEEIKILKGEIYFKKNDLSIAEEIYLNGIKELKKFKNEVGLGNAYYRLGELYNKQEKYEESNSNLNLALILLKKNNVKDIISEVYKLLSKNSIKLNDLNSALVYQSQKNEILDSNSKQNISTLIKNMELKNDIERKNQEVLLIQKENEKQIIQKNNLVIIFLIVLIAMIIIFILLYSRYKLKNRTTKELTDLNATKDKFFTIISHDLKTPIASINNLTELFYENYASINENDKMSYIKSIKDSSEKLLNLTNNLLIWSNLQTKKLTPAIEIINIYQIIQEEINLLKQYADKKGITLDFDNVKNLYVVADKSMLAFIIRNLLSNAIKFSYKDNIINIFSTEKNDNIEITISDTGIGISDEIKDKLFNINFKSTINGTDNEKGTGLGLNLSKEFLEKINGKIWFESEYAKGSSFIITLPQANKEDIYE